MLIGFSVSMAVNIYRFSSLKNIRHLIAEEKASNLLFRIWGAADCSICHTIPEDLNTD
jgi:hypothetical protein